MMADQQRLVDAAVADAKAPGRRAMRRCVPCFYFRRGVVGHAFTAFDCRACGEEHRHHNTGVPKLCDGCADARGLCVHCGGLREKPDEPPSTPAVMPPPRKPSKPSAPKRRKAVAA